MGSMADLCPDLCPTSLLRHLPPKVPSCHIFLQDFTLFTAPTYQWLQASSGSVSRIGDILVIRTCPTTRQGQTGHAHTLMEDHLPFVNIFLTCQFLVTPCITFIITIIHAS